MSGPGPWSDEQRRAEALVKTAREVQPRSMDVAHGWDDVLEGATRPRRQPWLIPAGALAVAAGIALGFFLMRARPAPIAPPAIIAAAGTQWEQRVDGGLQLQLGRVEALRPVNVSLDSPQVSILTTTCRFAAEVVSEGTRITIFEGELVVRSGDAPPRVLHAGESALFAALPPIPAAFEPAAVAPSEQCAQVGAGERASCLKSASSGEGLEAENALFELGRLQASSGERADAIDTWRTSLTRFPEGVFSPEARLALLVALTQQGRFGEAIGVAKAFEAAAADDPRREEVEALRKQLEWRTRQR